MCVKGGENVNVAMIRDMAHVVDREKAKVGIFITLAEATGPMKTEAVKAGFYETRIMGKSQNCKSSGLPIYSPERNRKFRSSIRPASTWLRARQLANKKSSFENLSGH